MKNLKTRIGAAALALVMALGLAACGSKTDSTAPADDTAPAAEDGAEPAATVEEIMLAATEKLTEAASMSYEMVMDMDMTVDGQSFSTKTSMQAECITDPMAMHMLMNMDMGEAGAMDIEMYLNSENGSYTLYTGSDDGTGNVAWTAQAIADADILAQYNAQASMDMYIASAENFVEAGEDDINGVSATRYDGTIAKSEMENVMTNSGMMAQLTGMGVSEEEALAIFGELDAMPISIWIDSESGMPVRYQMDETAVVQAVLDNSAATGDTKVTVDSVQVDMVLGSINGVDAIDIPQEVLDAAA